MAQITIPVPDLNKDWRTTLWGIATSAAYAGISYYLSGGLSWKEALGCAAWAVKCYLSADSATVKDAAEKIDAMVMISMAQRISPVE